MLDLEEPWKVMYRGSQYLMSPQKIYECVGDVPNVAFPCAALHDPKTDELRVYYGAADTCVCLATAQLSDLLEAVRPKS